LSRSQGIDSGRPKISFTGRFKDASSLDLTKEYLIVYTVAYIVLSLASLWYESVSIDDYSYFLH